MEVAIIAKVCYNEENRSGKRQIIMTDITNKHFTGERALYNISGTHVSGCVFEVGESPVKECRDLTIERSLFKWRYPIWYSNNIAVRRCTFFDDARASVWYCDNVTVEDCMVGAPKSFRRCRGLTLSKVSFSHGEETLWHCSGVTLNGVTTTGDYFAMNSENIVADDLTLYGKYSFDGCKNVTVRNSRMLTKDAFWNSENITVRDSFISGEYLGWNSKNLTFENCTVESLQGLCYIENLVMKNCTLINTTLAFEYSSVEAEISSGIDSVFNPKSGTITAPYIGELIVDKDRDTGKMRIICGEVGKKLDAPEWGRNE